MIDHFIDIYSKLLLGILTVAAPITTYFLSTYIKDRVKILNKLSEQKSQTDEILAKRRKKLEEKGAKESEIVKECNGLLKSEEEKIERKVFLLESLNPKSSIVRIFGPLFLALILLLIDVLLRDGFHDLYNHSVCITLMLLSLALFVLAMSLIWWLVWRLIEAKEMLADDETEILLETQSPAVEESKPEPIIKPKT